MNGSPLTCSDDAEDYGGRGTCPENLLRISREITTTTDPDKLYRTVVALAGELLGFDCFSLLLLDEEGERLVEASASGFGRGVEPWVIPLSGDDPAARAVQTCAPVSSVDLERRLRPPCSDGAVSSALCIPLTLHDKVFGSLAGFTRTRRHFDLNDISLLQTMADLAAPAIQNARHMRALRESEEKFRTLFNSASDAVFISTLDGRLIEVNQVACDRLGYSRDELLTMAPQYAAFPHYMTGVSERTTSKRDSKQLVFETIHIRKDGSVFPVEVSSRLIEFDGAPALLGIARDITERREAEETLHEVKERLKIILHSIQAGIVLIDAETHKIVDSNDTAILMTGYSRSELIGSSCRMICPCNAGGCPITDLGQQVDNSEQVLLTAKDRKIPILKSVVGINLEGRKHLLESFIDITDRKLAEEALKRSHDFAKTVLDSISDSVCIIDVQDKRVLGVNRVFLQELGLNEDDVIGRICSEVIDSCGQNSEGGSHFCPLDETLRTGEYARADQVFTRNGEIVHVEVSTSPIRNKEGQIVQVVHVARDISERKRAESEIQQLAYYDTLTGLPNRLLFRDRLDQSIAQAARDARQSAVFFLDLDRFKGINDSLGHAVGDKLLKTVAHRLLDCVRKSDTVARLGGDEFVLILSAISNEEDVGTIAGKVLSVLAAPVELDGQEIFSTGSIGIAVYPVDGQDVDTLLKNADIAMYQAKEQGRNNYQFFSREMNVKAVERLVLEMSLRHALDREEFFLFYQPQVNLTTGLMTGMEALLRWRHPDLGIFSPAKFIPLAEESGLIVPIGEWVLRTACAQNKKWQQAGYPPVRVAVNLSAHQFMQQNLVDMVAGILAETGLDPEWLELELTESALMENVDNARRTLRRFKDMGIRISIDDFGTGYSSLSYLKHFPIDRLKIAQYFVRDITTNPDDAAIAEAIIAMAHSLKLNVIAEGVERCEQMEFLRSRFCDEMQGYYFSVPVSTDDFTSLLAVGASLVHH